jgi:hypothetical protein
MTIPPPLLASASKPDQIGILVANLEAALAAFGSNQRWCVWTYGPETLASQHLRGQAGSFRMRVALNATEPQIELIEPIAGPSIYHEWIKQRGYGLHHFGFWVNDGAAAIRDMETAGYEVLQSGAGLGSDGSGVFAYFDTFDLLGFIIEAIERPRRRRQPELLWPRDRIS